MVKIKIFLILTLIVLFSCSPEKNNIVSKSFHTTVALFNGYYHANELYKDGVNEVVKNYKLPPTGFVSLLFFDQSTQNTSLAKFDNAISKCDVIIIRHKNGTYLDDSYLLRGKCLYYKNSYYEAIINFEYMLETFSDSKLEDEINLWLAKCYFMIDNPLRAKNLLKPLLNQAIKKDVKTEIAALYIKLAIDEERYSDAIEVLEENIDYVKPKRKKAYWYYLLAQLYEETGKENEAFDLYTLAQKHKPGVDLIFQAKLNQAKLIAEGEDSSEENREFVQKTLKKLLRDVKYDDYKDRIYYQLAMVNVKEGDLKEAKVNLRNSLNANKGDMMQKTLSYFEMGKIFFYKEQNLDQAQLYFDSAATTVQPEYPDYDLIKDLSGTLGDYKKHKTTIHLQDSLLKLSKLTDDQLDKYVDNLLIKEAKMKRDAERAQRKKEADARASSMANLMLQSNQQDMFNTGSPNAFVFDDPALTGKGKAEFARLWGERKNEDNWRRKNKAQTFSDEDDLADKEGSINPLDTVKTAEGRKNIYLANVPRTEAKQQQAIQLTEEAYFKLAQLFKDKLDEKDSAIFYFEKALKLFPESDDVPKVLYALYNIYEEDGHPVANRYKDRILDGYPKCMYAKLIRNEDVSSESGTLDDDFELSLAMIYELVDSKEYETATNLSDFLIQGNKDADLAGAYYLQGYSKGKMNNIDEMVTIYQKLIKEYPESQEAEVARKTLTFLNKKFDDSNRPTTTKAVLPAKKPDDPAMKGFMSKRKPNEFVSVVIVIPIDKIGKEELKNMLSDFKNKYFVNENLNNMIFKQDNFHICYISTFSTYQKANTYAEAIKSDGTFRNILTNPEDQVLMMSASNFRVAFQQKRFTDYAKFQKANKQKLLDEK